ncbi:MAG: hypothetical protein WCG25_09815 [bacterium]
MRSHLSNNTNFHVFVSVAHIYIFLFKFSNDLGKSFSKLSFNKLFFNKLILGKKLILFNPNILKSKNLSNISCAEYQLHRYDNTTAHILTPYTASILSLNQSSSNHFKTPKA